MKKIKKFLCFYSLPLFSALLMAISYIPFPPYALFFCYVPLWLFALRQKRLWSILKGAWLCQFCATLLGFHWLAYTFREFGFFPWPLSVIGLLGFASFANLHIPIALGLWSYSQKFLSPFCETKKPLSSPPTQNHHKAQWSWIVLLGLPLYSALSMQYYPMIFEWHYGYSWFYAGWPAAQTAEIWGFRFLNSLTLFLNCLVLYIYLKWPKPLSLKPLLTLKKQAFWRTGVLWAWFRELKAYGHASHPLCPALYALALGTLLFLFLNILGLSLKNRWPEPDQTARVLIIQPNMENLNTIYRRSKKDPRAKALSQLIKKTDQFFKAGSPQNLDFILWPEGAYPYRIRHNQVTAQGNFAGRQAKKWQTPLLLSATGESPIGVTNSLFAFNQAGRLIQPPYDKTILLVFGEYLPGEKWLNWSKWLSYYGRSFKRGTGEHKTLDLNLKRPRAEALPLEKEEALGVRLGLQICYESLFDFFTRKLAQNKAQILINVTNDSWYGRGLEPYQHLYMTLPRAIEVRRPLVRGTNTGFSAVISAKGDILKKSAIYKEDSWIQEVPYYSDHRQSLWTSWGYYINTVFLWGLFCLLFFYALIQAFKKSKNPT